MGRLKKSDRDDVLMKAMPLFWRRGFSDTGLEDLEIETGLNRSELYSEFGGKEDLFVATLHHYYLNRGGTTLLFTEPLGWNNIEGFLMLVAEGFLGGLNGCFAVNTLRELELLPQEVSKIIAESRYNIAPYTIASALAGTSTTRSYLFQSVVPLIGRSSMLEKSNISILGPSTLIHMAA